MDVVTAVCRVVEYLDRSNPKQSTKSDMSLIGSYPQVLSTLGLLVFFKVAGNLGEIHKCLIRTDSDTQDVTNEFKEVIRREIVSRLDTTLFDTEDFQVIELESPE